MTRTPEPPPHSFRAAGFTLPAILVVVGALLVLAVGILLVASLERSTARSYVDRERAELASRAGLEDIRGVLAAEAANDDFLVIQSRTQQPVNGDEPDRRPAPFLFLARGRTAGSDYTFRYVPLFSTRNKPSDAALAAPAVEALLGSDENQIAEFKTLPYQDWVSANWLPVKDDKGRTVARYAYWVEDLQGKVDPSIAGNEDGGSGLHARAEYPFPAPGLNPDASGDPFGQNALDQIALFAMDPSATDDQQGSVGRTLFNNRELLVSPDSSLAAAGFSPPLKRLDQKGAVDPLYPDAFGRPGELVDEAARAVEEGLAPELQGYQEQALVPFAKGIDPSVAGSPKLNLNKLLATGGDSAVGEMSDFIGKGLPDFVQRKGGFQDDYLKTLSANALDYADADREPTASSDKYRGLDAYPLVSEFLMTFKWTGVPVVKGRKVVEIKVSTFVELWNMTNQQVSGKAKISYETGYTFSLGANPDLTLADLSETLPPKLEESDGYHWFPEFDVSLKPNQYQVYRCGEVTYRIDAGPSSFYVPSPITLGNETYGESKAGYRMKWNGKIVDQSRGGVHRNDISLKYPTQATTRATVPGHSYKWGPSSNDWRDNMGDPRMSFYLQAPQDANSYPQNYSPNRRNIRWGSIYSSDGATKPKIYGRVMPSEWPDGGHNSECGSLPISGVDTTSDPDDPKFMNLPSSSPLLNPNANEAPMRLSNLGRFYSATELGRVYDPIIWAINPPSGANLPYGDVLVSTKSANDACGGNTLRIGRPEHPRFDSSIAPGQQAWRLLDLFHAGLSRSTDSSEREGPLVSMAGHVNLNTASRDALRALALGVLKMDPELEKRTSESHVTSGLMAPPTTSYKPTSALILEEANRIADAIIALRGQRPFASPSEIADARAVSGAQIHRGKLVFGNKELVTDTIADSAKIQWSDSAAEEVYGRVYEASTVRSRNFRIWVIGQAVNPVTASGSKPEVLAEVRRSFTVFADPGERKSDGSIDPAKTKLTILHENDF